MQTETHNDESDGIHKWVWYSTYEELDSDTLARWRQIMSEEHISEQAIKDSNCSLYPSGTILLAMYGQGTTRGRVAQLRTDAAVNQAIAAIQVQDETESLFLYSMLKVCYDYVRNLAVGGNQHNLNLKLVSSIPLIVPPKELQLKFVSIAKHADKSGFDLRKSIDAIDAVIKRLINGIK